MENIVNNEYITNYQDIVKNIYENINNDNYNINDLLVNLRNKEEDVTNIVNRVVELKNNKKIKNIFTKESIENVSINIFKNLNLILEEISSIENLTFKEFKKILKKDNRIIYIGLFFIIIALSLLLIEISDNI